MQSIVDVVMDIANDTRTRSVELLETVKVYLACLHDASPSCPTCDGTGNLHPERSMFNFCDPCPDCDDGKVTFQQMAATYRRVWQFDNEDKTHGGEYGDGWRACIAHLREVKPEATP